MRSRTWKKPKKQGALSAYYVPDGVTATLSSYSTAQVEWVAKKLMSYCMIDEEAVEDSRPDVVDQVLEDFGDAVGEAEEQAFISGDPTHQATAPTPESATETNWFVFDPRLIFEGIFPVSLTADAATAVDAGGAVLDLDNFNKAIYNLGKYGRNRGKLRGYASSVQAAQIRQNDEFKDASVTGMALASFINGLGAAGERDGIITMIYGVPIYEAPAAPDAQVVLMDRNTARIGDRRLIKYKSAEVIESDQRKYVVSERVAFNYDYRDAIVTIKDLSTSL